MSRLLLLLRLRPCSCLPSCTHDPGCMWPPYLTGLNLHVDTFIPRRLFTHWALVPAPHCLLLFCHILFHLWGPITTHKEQMAVQLL